MLHERFEQELLAARDDAEPRLYWHGGWLQRFRGHAYWLPGEVPESLFPLPATGALGQPLSVANLELRSTPFAEARGSLPAGTAFRLELRRGGERFRAAAGHPSRQLKSLLQELAVPPWHRQRLWLLWLADELAAVLDPDSGRVVLQAEVLRGWSLLVVDRQTGA